MELITIGAPMMIIAALISTRKTVDAGTIMDVATTISRGELFMHSNFHGDWFCGPGSFFSGFHFGGVLHLLIWGIVLFLLFKAISLLISGSRNEATATGAGNPSLSILEKRYASGEINQEEFLQKKRDLLD